MGGDFFDYMTFHLMTLLFVILKVAGFIDWSWWYIFIPTYISATLMIFTWIIEMRK